MKKTLIGFGFVIGLFLAGAEAEAIQIQAVVNIFGVCLTTLSIAFMRKEKNKKS